jgi:AraC-like DNA-binding protein
MRTEQLKYLVDVAETKSMSKTAEKMFVSPQAVSQSIRQLETELDIELFVRNSQGVSLTKLGEGIVEKAKAMMLDPRINVKDIGIACGYSDSNYFARVFKRITGQTPSEYRLAAMQDTLLR